MNTLALRRSIAAPSMLSRQAVLATRSHQRFISTTSTLRKDEAEAAADRAADSFKRGAANTGKVASSAGKFVKDTLKDVGAAAKEIFQDGSREGKEFRKEAGDAVRNRISGKNKDSKP